VAICHDRAISVYDAVDGERLSLLQGHQSEGLTARFQPGSDWLASQGWDGLTRLWDPIRGRLLVTLRGHFRGWVGDESSLVVGREDDLILYRITAAKERRTVDCRMLSAQAGTALFGPARVTFAPDGRTIAMALRPEGVRIVRASDGVGLAHLPIGNCDEVLYLPDGSLLTSNDHGLCRWPVRPLERGRLRMGPPEPLAPIDRRAGIIPSGLASSASGRRVGVVSPGHRGSLFLDPEEPWRRTRLSPRQAVSVVAISPDGRWSATAGWETSGDDWQVRIWDVSTGQFRVALPASINSSVAFSPDGRWVAVGSVARCQFFETGTWTLRAEVEQGSGAGSLRIAFHPGSRVAALMGAGLSTVRLVDVKTGRVLASLEAPQESSIYCLAFSPDGRYLAASHTDQRIDLWDLNAIRLRLEALDLATGLPDVFGGDATAGGASKVDSIEVLGADRAGLRLLAVRQTVREAGFAFRGMLDAGLADAEELRTRGVRWLRLGDWRMAVADFRASLARDPNSDFTANELAWCLAVKAGRGDADEAVRWARKAVELVPGNPDYRNTLGAALYRAGRFAEAAVELEQDIALNPPTIGYDWLFLAMCKQRLGLAAEARFALDQASRWGSEGIRAFPGHFDEFHALLREAHAVLDESRPGSPSDVFDR
jgi:WD40 repeat protein